ncbi:type II toxin-antitoxin system HicA family toxin [Curtobacterium sp. MCSS17_007]|uniref:type II toxin-antitoxin system HicA family toxin n=1 Tax=Curtobacterium sp. MCSS17_007 TaxID=2175646 RepID=UPI000DA988AA|nr:type II toxin-antitoxin system HicA family toxin [Curtobacterium sp. MCSS17_007]WIE76408.1 type II toxin-antitoxin system HicA family toxin [Curtobacterium sp. MCSS17_007]
MKRAELLRRLDRLAAGAGVDFRLHRHGGRHDVYRFGPATVVVPRHREIEEQTARAILRNCERKDRWTP